MTDLFESIGFDVPDDEAYEFLARCADSRGSLHQVTRDDICLRGKCWKISEGVEIWSVDYEKAGTVYYSECRPAFRGKYVYHLEPWELVEYDEDGGAILRGVIGQGAQVSFELQNLSELGLERFHEPHLHVSMAGLARSIAVQAAGEGPPAGFVLAETLPEYASEACETDFLISGQVLARREIHNPFTENLLTWLYVDVGEMGLEVLVNSQVIERPIRIGGHITAEIWLQGHILEVEEVYARYEGVDREFQTSDFWVGLKRDN